MEFKEVWDFDKKSDKTIKTLAERHPHVGAKAMADIYLAGAKDVLEVLKDDTELTMAINFEDE